MTSGTERRRQAAKEIEAEAPLDHISVYVRAGSILPMGLEIVVVGSRHRVSGEVTKDADKEINYEGSEIKVSLNLQEYGHQKAATIVDRREGREAVYRDRTCPAVRKGLIVI